MKPTLIFGFLLSLLILCLLNLKTIAVPTFVGVLCQNETSLYNLNGTYHTNLKTLFSVLSSNATRISGFYNSTAGRSPPDIAYGLFLCRGDVTPDACTDCVTTAGKQVVEKCPRLKATIWYDQCMLRHSNESFFSTPDQNVALILENSQNVTDPNGFNRVLIDTLNGIATRAPNGNDLGKRFAVAEANFSSIEKLYTLAQCTQDISSSDCNSCLVQAVSGLAGCCATARGAQYLFPSCSVRFELYQFYNVAAALPPSPTTTPGGNGGVSSQLLIAIIVPVGVSILIFIAGFCFLARRRAKNKYDTAPNEDNVVSEMEAAESLRYDLASIQAATNNFSDDNKIGEGGFGGVYKGTLLNGQEIAVKRLSQNSGQGAQEFKNEVALVAKLQHRNLARLLGFCFQGGEKILIYEFVPNKSLDYFLFDSQERVKLDWSRRYKIIGGIARGMLYLHEESRLKIIHRDLKASNVLVDGDMNAKVSDFGMARIFGVDQTQGNTSRVVGTYGYMSPEYAMHGEFSVKSDVYSFGVLVLEIISGQKSNNFYQPGYAEDLPNYAWKLWRDERPLELMDPTLEGSYSRNEVTRCIHMALLCVQEDPNCRPSMATIVLMLNSYSLSMSIPQQPAFFTRTRMGSNASKGLDSDTSASKSMQWSVNEVSITEFDPR